MIINITKISCDRCGAEMDERGRYGMSNLTPHMKIDKCCSDGWKTLDICKKCADSFEAWWKGGRNSEYMG